MKNDNLHIPGRTKKGDLWTATSKVLSRRLLGEVFREKRRIIKKEPV